VDKNLVTRDGFDTQGDGDARFGMLETIREYALEQLEISGEADQVRAWHATYYLGLAESVAAHFGDNINQGAWLDRLAREHDNMRAALEWATGREQKETALRLVAALANFWLLRGHLSEGRRWFDTVLAKSDEQPASLRARAFHAAGQLAQYQSDFDRAEAFGNESLALYRLLDDRPVCVAALQALARVARMRGQHAASRALYQESLAVSNEIGDRGGAADRVSVFERGCADRYLCPPLRRRNARSNAPCLPH